MGDSLSRKMMKVLYYSLQINIIKYYNKKHKKINPFILVLQQLEVINSPKILLKNNNIKKTENQIVFGGEDNSKLIFIQLNQSTLKIL